MDYIYDTEYQVKQYYRNMDKIKGLQAYLLELDKQAHIIKEEMQKNQIYLEADMAAVKYDTPAVQVSGSASVQERALENAYRKKEHMLQAIELKSISIQNEILDLESGSIGMSIAIKNTGEEYRRIIEALYRDNIKQHELAAALHIDRSNISRKKNEALLWISRYILHDSSLQKRA